MKRQNKVKNKLIGSLVVIGLMFGCASNPPVRTNADFANGTVMIKGRQAGGTGVVLHSTSGGSEILTNKHICDIVQQGGTVYAEDGATFPVHSYRVYQAHDLCLIKVMGNLHYETKLAPKAPLTYSGVEVSGHPALLPTIITRGHFSKKMIIDLIVGVKPCLGNEQDEEAIFCAMMGMKPIIRSFQAQAISATIMPGSSGSGAYNYRGELAGLVFAGPGEGIGYGFLVPYEYVRDFLFNKDAYPERMPDPDKKPESLFADISKMEKFCKTNQKACRNLKTNGLYDLE